MGADYWMTVTVPVLNAVGDLEEEGADRFSLAVISERSGVAVDKVELLVDRLTKGSQGGEWLSGTFVRGGDGSLARILIDGLGPRGMEAVRGHPGQEAMIVALERLAETTSNDQDRSALRRAADLLRDAPSDVVAGVLVETAKRLVTG
jgi:hypothetical protein